MAWGLLLPAVCVLAGCGTTRLERDSLGPNLTLISDFGPSERAEIGRRAAASYSAISNHLGFASAPAEPTELYVFRWPAGYKAFIRRHAPQFFDSPACIFRERGKLIIAIRAAVRKTRWNIRHELTHAALASNRVEAPQWIDEGLAQYFEAGSEPGTLDPEWLADVQRSFRNRENASIVRLIISDSAGRFDRPGYRASWMLVRFLIRRHGVDALLQYAQQVAAGEPEPTAFMQCFDLAPFDLQPEWEEYVLSLKPDSDD